MNGSCGYHRHPEKFGRTGSAFLGKAKAVDLPRFSQCAAQQTCCVAVYEPCKTSPSLSRIHMATGYRGQLVAELFVLVGVGSGMGALGILQNQLTRRKHVRCGEKQGEDHLVAQTRWQKDGHGV